MGSVIGIQLAEDSANVALNRLLTNPQEMGDLFVCVAIGNVIQNLCFPMGEGRGYALHSFPH